ncbi:MAG: hypothetical protein IT460_09265 [Planctomycetes bacterium]|nr:hypothetical protein [Planctomycetota bacterium]
MRTTRRALLLLAVLPALALVARADEPPAAPAPPPGGRMYDPRFREGTPSDVLVAGDTPLLRGTVDAFVDLIEARHDVTLTATEEQTVRDGLETAWPKMDDDERRWFDRQAAALARIRPAPGAAYDAAAAKPWLDAFATDLDARVSKASSHAWEGAVRRAVDRKSVAFSAAPDPSVSVAAQDAFEELVVFFVGLARNADAAPTEGQRIAVRPSVRRAMDASGPVVRRHYARMGRLWALVKARWDACDDAGKLRMRWAALRLFRRVAKLPVPEGTVVLDLPGYATMAAEVAAALNAPDAYTSAFANLGETIGAVVDGLGLDAKDLEPAFAVERLSLRR